MVKTYFCVFISDMFPLLIHSIQFHYFHPNYIYIVCNSKHDFKHTYSNEAQIVFLNLKNQEKQHFVLF